jgi:hypothetical protein
MADNVHGYETAYYASITSINSLFIGEANRINVDLAGGNIRREQAARDSLFTNSDGRGFYLTSDFHVKNTCNCSDKGVYSGEGNFRPIPPIHIAAKNVQASTNNNFLKFTFRVKTDN